MLIEIVQVAVENKGKYRVANVTYKNSEGKVDAKKVMSFTYKDVFKVLSDAKLGDKFEVKPKKNEAGYWEWTEAVSEGKSLGASDIKEGYTKAFSTARSTYETPEERAKKQVYIVRQSSITAALELAKLKEQMGEAKTTPSENEIIESAKIFEAYVFDVKPVQEAEVK